MRAPARGRTHGCEHPNCFGGNTQGWKEVKSAHMRWKARARCCVCKRGAPALNTTRGTAPRRGVACSRTMPATLKATLSELFRCLLWPTMLSLTPMTASVIAMTSGVSGEAAHTTWTTVPDMHRGRARRLAGLMASITFGALSRQPLRVVRTDCTWCQWQHRVAPHMELIG